jgi:hypothetical protein
MNTDQPSVRPFERLLLQPWQSALRAALGFAILPALVHWRGAGLSIAALLVHFVAALLALRVATMLFRRLPLFSAPLKAAWLEQRQLAKRYDSYQWAKLLPIGAGMAAYAAYAGRLTAPEGVLAAGCIAAGSVAVLLWRQARMATTGPATSAGAAHPTAG